MSIEAFVGEQQNFIVDPEWDSEPVQWVEDGGYVLVFSDSHQDPGSAVLNVLQLLDVLARNPGEESVAVVQSRGDEGKDKLLSISQG